MNFANLKRKMVTADAVLTPEESAKVYADILGIIESAVRMHEHHVWWQSLDDRACNERDSHSTTTYKHGRKICTNCGKDVTGRIEYDL